MRSFSSLMGESKITPFVNGKPRKVTVRMPAGRGAEIAASLQDGLTKRQWQNVRPWIDFEHKQGVSAGNPKSFRYEPGKGIVMALDWSASGKKAIDGKNFSYFSPRFDLGENGGPTGILARGPLGGLVNEPAFRDIPRIAALNVEINQQPPMKTILVLATCGLLSQDEAAQTDADSLAASRVNSTPSFGLDPRLAIGAGGLPGFARLRSWSF